MPRVTPAAPATPAKRVRVPALPIAAEPDADPDLAKAAADLAAGRSIAALDALLRAWERRRTVAVARAIDELGAVIARSLPAIEGTKTTLDAAWRDVGDQLRSADVPRLVEALDRGSAPQARGWLDLLLRFPIDPRLAAPAVALTTKFVSSTAGSTRTRAFKLAHAIADGRSHAQIDELADSCDTAWNRTALVRQLTQLAAKIPAPPALPPPDAPALKQITAAIAALAKQPPVPEAALFASTPVVHGDGDRLLAAVLADPHDEANRTVYADYLLQQGDVRGELITLQTQPQPLTREQAARVRALVRDPKHLKAWLGPLVAVVTEPVFERGFLAGCRAFWKTAKQRAALVDHPLWATVKDLWTDDLELVRSPALRSLETVRALELDAIAELATARQPLRITSLVRPSFTDVARDKPRWQAVLASRAFSNLRHFGPFEVDFGVLEELGDGPKGWSWILDTPVGKQLATFTLHLSGQPDLGPWLALMKQRNHLERLQLDTGNYGNQGNYVGQSFALVRERAGRAVAQVVWRLEHPAHVDASDLTPRIFAGIAGVPELVISIGGTPKPADRTRITELAMSVYARQFQRVTIR